MMQMGNMQHEAKLGVALNQRSQQSHGVRPTGDGDGEAQPGTKQRCVERQGMHVTMIPASR